MTTDLASFHTARDLRSHLTDLGVEGDAAECLVKETAHARHAWRVGQARDLALAGARAFLGVTDAADGGAAGYPERGVRAMAAALCLLDQVGVGGRDGVEGLATERLPAFRGLGKGRKQASDGGAWDAAILGARRELCGTTGAVYTSAFTAQASLFACDDGRQRPMVSFYVACSDVDSAVAAPSVGAFLDEVPAEILPWFLTLVRDGLRCVLGQSSWHGVGDYSRPAADWAYDGPAQAWAECVNTLTSRQRQVEAERGAARRRDCPTAVRLVDDGQE